MTRSAFDAGQVLLDGVPMNYNGGNYGIFVRFDTDGVLSHTISAPMPDDAHQFGCGLTNEVLITLGSFPNPDRIPGDGERSFHEDFFIDPPLNER